MSSTGELLFALRSVPSNLEDIADQVAMVIATLRRGATVAIVTPEVVEGLDQLQLALRVAARRATDGIARRGI